MNVETRYAHALELIAELSCLLNDVEHDFGLEDYNEAETTLMTLIEQARTLLKLLQLIRTRPTTMHSSHEANDSDIANMIELEGTCRRLASHAIKTHNEKHPAFLKNKTIFNPIYQLTFYRPDSMPLITHTATIKYDDNGKPYFLLKHFDEDNEHSNFIFDQLNQCPPIALSIDEILSINTIRYELNLTVLKNLKVGNR
jgi:hypothetical protein